MMASNFLSRLLPNASDEPYQDGRSSPPQNHRRPSADDQGEMDIDEENFEARFEAQDLENLLADATSSQMTTESTAFLPQNNDRKVNAQHARAAAARSPAWRQPSSAAPLDDDDDVPESLLLEGGRDPPAFRKNQRAPAEGLPPPVPGPSTRQTQAQWDATRRQQRLHDEGQSPAPVPQWGVSGRSGPYAVDPRDRAFWLWVNVQDLDRFLQAVYGYYAGRGIYSILLRKVLHLLQMAFVVTFVTFLAWCIDYSKLPGSGQLSQVIVPKCTKRMHGFFIFALWIFIIYWLWAVVQLVLEIPSLRRMHDFYLYLLDIPDRDIQSIQWQQVVNRIMALRDQNLTTAVNLSPETRKLLDSKSRQRLDAIDIASRLMRKENFLISLFNKEILDVTVPVPFLGNRYIFSETTEWHVNLAIMQFVFSAYNDQFNPDFLKERNRRDLVKKLQNRLRIVGLISIVCAPFTVSYILASYLFRYFTEYHKDPSLLSSRDFTPFAKWRFREFNELPHLFDRRKNMAYPYANRYLAQFPKDKTEQISAFVAFIAGAFAFVLVCFTLLDSELFLGFEITQGKTVIFWIGVLTAIYQMARSSSPQDDQVADPSYFLGHVIYHTHYEPGPWKDRLHTDEVRGEFAQLYKLKVLIFVEEVLSMIITPFLLIFRLPQCSEAIVDFFREFSIQVDGLGTVCSYSIFPFKKGANNAPSNIGGPPEDRELREDYFNAKDNKMINSYYGFLDTYGTSGRGQFNGRLQGKGSFHPPPQFPANFEGASAHVPPSEVGARGASRGPHGIQPFRGRTPRHGPTALRDEPVSSFLLDPHHQPSSSAMRGSPRQTPRYRSSLQTVSDNQGQEAVVLRASRIEEESMIGDSWRTSRLATDEDDEEEATGNAPGGGVLHLLQEFSKARTEGRGPGVGM
ncbi:autophagy-related protein 9 [Polyplosphaeria fusca]|uniref:Autophagy-related protein 9 n=1 Tax=Polyplosphaeria fusca TaxID=682080 RepID=A0A9P4V4D2_9PLEO|nr:autophagy-related protein 9 [Polyplosphaeria fusca]